MNLRRTSSLGLATILALTQATVAWGVCCCLPGEDEALAANPQMMNAGHCPGCVDSAAETPAAEDRGHCDEPENSQPMDSGCETVRLDTAEFAPVAATVLAQAQFMTPIDRAAWTHTRLGSAALTSPHAYVAAASSRSLIIVHQSFRI